MGGETFDSAGEPVVTTDAGVDSVDTDWKPRETVTVPTDAAVVGVGNPTRGDDGLGRAVVRKVDGGTFAGTTAFFALEAMSGTHRAVVVDAIDAEGPPGTVHRYRLDATERASPTVSMHDVTFSDALRSGGVAYDLPDRVTLIGIVPDSVAAGVGVSEPVTRAVPAALELIERELYSTGTTMEATWYCQDCAERIDAEAIDDHEDRGHAVRGRLRPERLLAEDPWETSDGGDTAGTAGDTAGTAGDTAGTACDTGRADGSDDRDDAGGTADRNGRDG